MSEVLNMAEELINENIALKKDNLLFQERIKSLEEEVANHKDVSESLAKKYAELSMRCVEMYASEKEIRTDTFTVQVVAPVFLSQEELGLAVVEYLKGSVLTERAKQFALRGEPINE